jgi:RES domain-containing protein
MIAWRTTKRRHPSFDGTGAEIAGARWNSAGRPVIYAADSFAGSILEIIAHARRPRTLPGPHHAVEITIPDELVVHLHPIPDGWDVNNSPVAIRHGERWLNDAVSPVFVVPALPGRPIARNVLINPDHPDIGRIVVSEPFAVPWDERLF